MTTDEALARFRAATVADLGAVDADVLTFGRFSRGELVDALNNATSCEDEGGYFLVVTPTCDLMVAIEGAVIHVGGARHR